LASARRAAIRRRRQQSVPPQTPQDAPPAVPFCGYSTDRPHRLGTPTRRTDFLFYLAVVLNLATLLLLFLALQKSVHVRLSSVLVLTSA